MLVAADGEIVGEGWHERAGGPHAETQALAAAGARARGATLFVTLEPCAHVGRTPPCVEAVVAAGVARVVASHRDVDPRTAGRGFARLRDAGVAVEIGSGAEAAIELNLPFLVSNLFGRPAVTLKWAASLDGKIATAAGESRWITGSAARRRGHELREEHDAIVVGSETVLRDDPRLTRRLGKAAGAIVRVVLDRRLRIPASSRLFDEPGPVVVYTESDDRARAAELERRSAEVVRLPRVDASSVLAELMRRDVQSVLVEGGAEVAAIFFDSGLWDRIACFVAPIVIGGGGARPALAGSGVARLAEAAKLARVRTVRRGDDLEIGGLNSECLRVLSSSVGA